jgi:hypothetical protein
VKTTKRKFDVGRSEDGDAALVGGLSGGRRLSHGL